MINRTQSERFTPARYDNGPPFGPDGQSLSRPCRANASASLRGEPGALEVLSESPYDSTEEIVSLVRAEIAMPAAM